MHGFDLLTLNPDTECQEKELNLNQDCDADVLIEVLLGSG